MERGAAFIFFGFLDMQTCQIAALDSLKRLPTSSPRTRLSTPGAYEPARGPSNSNALRLSLSVCFTRTLKPVFVAHNTPRQTPELDLDSPRL